MTPVCPDRTAGSAEVASLREAAAPLPAVILCQPETAGLRIAGLSLADRLVVAVHRAGAVSIRVLSSGPPPVLSRSRALGIPVTISSAPPTASGPVLVVSTGMVVHAGELSRLLLAGGRLVSRTGEPLPAGVLGKLTAEPLEALLAGLAPVRAEGLAERIGDAASLGVARRAFWASLSSPADGRVDRYFNRPAGRLLSKILVHTPVSPNMVSVVAAMTGLLSAWYFAQGGGQAPVLGAILLQVSTIVDCVDGDLARAVFKESRLGWWLDIGGDQVVHVAVFSAIGCGLYRSGAGGTAAALGASAAIGVLISFAVVLRGRRLSALRAARSQRLVDAATNRDFSVLLLVLALVGKLEWFLWVTAIGVHAFWLSALWAQRGSTPAAKEQDAPPGGPFREGRW